MTAVKICGVTDASALDAAIRAQADFAGLVFFPASPRHLSLEQANALAQRSGDAIRRVGLFVDADHATIAEAVAAASLDVVQLHGSETPERALELKTRLGLPIWKAVPVSDAVDVARAERYLGVANLVLFDARTPPGAALPGGMGLRFEWSLLSPWRGRCGWGLAGGLSPSNVGDAIALTGAPLVDTSSGVETAPGVKDVAAIGAFCAAARRG